MSTERQTIRLNFGKLGLPQLHEIFLKHHNKQGLFVPDIHAGPVGSEIDVEMVAAEVEPPVRCQAKIIDKGAHKLASGETKEGMVIQFTGLDAHSQRRLEGTDVEEEPIDLGMPLEEDEGLQLDRPTDDHTIPLTSNHTVNDTVIGIDLGTSNSCVAIIKDGEPFIIPASTSSTTVPSVVAIRKTGAIIVGRDAKEQICLNPTHTVYGAKRFVGRPFHSPFVTRNKEKFVYEVKPGENGQVAVQLGDETMSLETISAHLLTHLKDLAQDYLEFEVVKAVITVPAYYNDNQRQAVKEAGRLAGLDVQRIVNEPTAAAIAYGFNRGMQTRILVYDLGGGTFDVSVLELNGNTFNVLATGGDNFLGGEDFDNAIVAYLEKEFQAQTKQSLSANAMIRERLKQGAEMAKRRLSDQDETVVNIPFLKTEEGKAVNLQIPLSRQKVSELVKGLIADTLGICQRVLQSGHLKIEDVNEIVLVGGQTHMPIVRETIEKHFNIKPRTDVNPDEAVALGAALVGGSIDKDAMLTLRDMVSISIGLALPGGRFKPIVPANTQVPYRKTFKYTLQPDNPNLSIDIFQGEFPSVRDNEYLGTLLFSDFVSQDADGRHLNLEFTLTKECLLQVVATDPVSGRSEEALLVTHDTAPSLAADNVNT